MKTGCWGAILSLALRRLKVAGPSFGTAIAFIVVFIGMASAPGLGECKNERTAKLIDRDWKFNLGDAVGAETKAFDDARWANVNLPHSFSLPYFLSPDVYSGYGWYRKNLDIRCFRRDRRYFLEFDGVFQVAEIYVNGASVGSHSGGYTGFSIDITQAVAEGQNLIAVKVQNLWNVRLNPRAGEHVFSGGIYRHVRLVETSSLHVSWYGTFVTTPHLNEQGGGVHITTELGNEALSKADYILRTTIIDPKGNVVGRVETKETLNGAASQIAEQDIARVEHPRLWSPDHPIIYTAISTIVKSGKVVDEYRTPFGFRWFEWTAEKGFFLNGNHLYFHGADVHQDHAGWGDAVSDDDIARDVRLIKRAGLDFIRGSHYPHSPVFADECDREGVLLWSENSFWGMGGEHKEGTWTASAYPIREEDQGPFEQSVKTSLAEMIRINRNHPSIIAWSMGNEVFFSDENVMPNVRALLKTLVHESHTLDPTRPAAIGGAQRGDLDHIGDIAGYNGDGARIFLDPGIANVVAEYGSTIADRPGPYAPGFGDLEGQPQYKWRSGQAIWCGFDHGSIVPILAHTGIIDYFRLPKRAWYWYRNAYSGIAPPKWPAAGTATSLRLTSDSSTISHADGRGSVQLIVSVLDANRHEISNSPAVTLEILSGPGELPTGRKILFSPDSDISIRDGKAAIEMRAFESGEIHLRASSPGLQSADLMVRSKGGAQFIRGKTRVVAERPYVEVRSGRRKLGEAMNASLDHPTKASSERPGHEGRFADDDDPQSFWEPTGNSKTMSWWQIDFENRVQVENVHLAFKDGRDRSYKVQISDDGKTWNPIATHKADSADDVRKGECDVPGQRTGIALRIDFPAGQAGPVQLTDVRVIGRAVFQ